MMKVNIVRYIFSCVFFFLLSFSSFASNQISSLIASKNSLIYYSDLVKAGKQLTAPQLKEVIQIAKARQQTLFNLLDDAKNIEPYLLSTDVIYNLPDEVKPFLEREIKELVGTLEVRVSTNEDNNETRQYLLLTHNKTYYLHFTDSIPDQLKTGDKIRITHAFSFLRTKDIYELILSNKEFMVSEQAVALPLSLGPQRTITFLVNFSDRPNDRPWTPSFITTLMYDTINKMFYESSYRQTTVVGRTVGWYVLSVTSSTSCQTLTNLVASQADQAATNAGVDLSQYDRKVYIFPKTSQCGWAGLGVVGGSKTRSWINGAASTVRTPGHELGHNFGIYHSTLLRCSSSPNTGNCSRLTYGDGTDIMGAGRQTHFNAFQKDVLGWLNYGNSPPITLVTTSGTYKIDPYETFNRNPKALKVLKRTGATDYYYLEYRQGIGFDSELASCGTSCDYTRGVVFHQGNTTRTDSSDLLDMSWTNPSSGRVALLPGQSFRDSAAPNGGVTFTVLSVDATGATVRITYG